MEQELTPVQSDPRYSPARLYILLRNYHQLDTRERMFEETESKRPKNRSARDPEKDRIDRKADVDRALARLTGDDPEAAAMIYSYYIDLWSVAKVAGAEGVAERTVYYRIQRGVRRMSVFLGWVEPKGA